jgi:exopolyphosphatase/guanosine-5'-triphosphate,3'-diphosphate pyrophosphatase
LRPPPHARRKTARFIRDAEEILGCKVRVLTGEEEAYFSALGIISGFHDPDGIVGDLGGGSLELVDIQRRRRSAPGITLPLGGLRLSETSGGSIAGACRSPADLNDARASCLKKRSGTHLLCRRRHLALASPSCTWK